jgi:hypothetical protein
MKNGCSICRDLPGAVNVKGLGAGEDISLCAGCQTAARLAILGLREAAAKAKVARHDEKARKVTLRRSAVRRAEMGNMES